MALSWIRVDREIGNDNKVSALAFRLKCSEATAVGHCTLVYIEMASGAKDGDLSIISDLKLESWARWPGKRGKFATTFREIFAPAGKVASWMKHNGDYIRLSEIEAERKRLQRMAGIETAAATANAAQPPRRARGKVRDGEDVTDDDFILSPAELPERIRSEVPAAFHDYLVDLLIRVDYQRSWLGYFEGALNGGNHRPLTGKELGETVQQFLGNIGRNEKPNSKYFLTHLFNTATGKKFGKRGGSTSKISEGLEHLKNFVGEEVPSGK